MNASETGIFCGNNHCYDISKKGYVNFIQKKPVKIYNAELFKHRRLLYSSGFYDQVTETMDSLAAKHRRNFDKCVILDAGCGEGTFLAELCNQINATKIGFDISKDAILQAGRNSKEIVWLVADLANIPIKDNCVDILFNIFTPANYHSFNRILKKDGLMIKVIPGTDYLRELRDAGKAMIKRQKDDEEQIVNHLSNYMEIVEKKRVYYKVNVNPEQLHSWIKMTPMMTNAAVDEEVLSNIKQVTIDVLICACKKVKEEK